MMSTHDAWIVRFLVFTTLAAQATASPLSPPTTAPADLDDYSTIIDYAVPASTTDARSRALVVVPRDYERPGQTAQDTRRYPVVYLLHGFGGHYMRYHEKLTEFGRSLTDLADRFGVILVMPDAGCCSWYIDAPADVPGAADWQYETILIKHVIPEIDARYRTWAERSGRSVTGISMGGHGALFLAARHPELFAAASSMSGVLDLRETLNPRPLAERIGTFEQHRRRWTELSVLAHADRFVGQDLALFVDCGWDDPFIWSNRALHDKLMRLNVAHDYIERPGKHEWKYWINALPYHLQFLTDRMTPTGEPGR